MLWNLAVQYKPCRMFPCTCTAKTKATMTLSLESPTFHRRNYPSGSISSGSNLLAFPEKLSSSCFWVVVLGSANGEVHGFQGPGFGRNDHAEVAYTEPQQLIQFVCVLMHCITTILCCLCLRKR